MLPDRQELIAVGVDMPWHGIEGMVFRIVEFIPFAGFDEVSGKFRRPISGFGLPYGMLLAESSQLSKQALIPIRRRSDFLKFWRVYEQRGVKGDEEVQVGCSPRKGLFARFRHLFDISIHAQGEYDHFLRGGPVTEALQRKNEGITIKAERWTKAALTFGTKEQKAHVERFWAVFGDLAQRIKTRDAGERDE